jgi:hypothetical protein
MSLRSFLDLSGMTVETYAERWGGRVFIGYRKGVSQMFGDAKALRRFLQLPVKTPSRERLDEWLAELEQPATVKDSLIIELADTGFGPEHHGDALDPSDPNHATRTVI